MVKSIYESKIIMLNKTQLKNRVVLAHRGFSDRTAHTKYRENSKEACSESSRKKYIDIIELDVRKSSDGILYCYHGDLFAYHIILKLPLPFSLIKKIYNVNTLKEVLGVINPKKRIFLDIKDVSITRDDILKHFRGISFKEVILGNKSVRYLNRFVDMPTGFVKVLNGNVLCNFYNPEKLRRSGFRYFEVVFAFQVNPRIFKKVQQSDLVFCVSGLGFFSESAYWRIIERYEIAHVSSDFIG